MAAQHNLTTCQAAALCDVSQQTIIRSFDRGDLRGWLVPGTKHRRIPVASLAEWADRYALPHVRPALVEAGLLEPRGDGGA